MPELWGDLQIVENLEHLSFLKRKPKLAERLEPFDEQEVVAMIQAIKTADCVLERPVKQVGASSAARRSPRATAKTSRRP